MWANIPTISDYALGLLTLAIRADFLRFKTYFYTLLILYMTTPTTRSLPYIPYAHTPMHFASSPGLSGLFSEVAD
jgi:hypothetical protein